MKHQLLKLLKHIFVLMLTIAATYSAFASEPVATAVLAPVLPLTAAQTSRDASLLISVLRDTHPGYARYRTKDAIEADELTFIKAAAGARNSSQFYLAVSAFLATIKCEHTEAELPAAISKWMNNNPSMLPVDFSWVEQTAIVTGVAPGISGVNIGDELLAINGHTMQSLQTSISPHISVDGFTHHTKAAIFAGTDDIGFTTFDVFYPLLHGFADSYQLTLRGADAVEHKVQVPAVSTQASAMARHSTQAVANFSDQGAVSWQQRGNAAVISINTFVNYRTPVDPESIFAPMFRAIKAANPEQLVVDLRQVGGGSTDVMNSLLRHLIDKPVSIGGPSRVKTVQFAAHRKYLSSWDNSIFNMPATMTEADGNGMFILSPTLRGGLQQLTPATQAWQGPLTILIGPQNESGATMLLAELRDERQLRLVGEATGGSAEGPTAGVIAFLALPESTIQVRVPLVWSTTSYQGFIPGMGITPDIIVPKTVADVRAGRDRALEIATIKII
jgi:hypothetical protein